MDSTLPSSGGVGLIGSVIRFSPLNHKWQAHYDRRRHANTRVIICFAELCLATAMLEFRARVRAPAFRDGHRQGRNGVSNS